MFGQTLVGDPDILIGDLRPEPTPIQQMRNLRRRPAAHKAIVNNISLVGPRPDLVLDELFREDRRMLESDLVLRRRSADVIEENVIDLSLFRSHVVVGKIVAADLGYAKRFESFLLLDRLHERVERLRLSLAETEHVLETLPVTLAAIARYRIVLGVDHRVVHPESRRLKCQRMPKARQRLVTIDGPIADYPNNNSTRFRLCEKPRGDLLDRKVISVIVTEVVVRRTGYGHVDHIVRQSAQRVQTVFLIDVFEFEH